MRAKDRKLQNQRGKATGSKPTQFKKGHSGGPGRPKNVTVVDVIQKAREIGDVETVEAFEQLQTNFVKAAATAALKGDAKSIGLLAKFFFRPLAPQNGDPLDIADLDLTEEGITASLRRITSAMASGNGDPASLKALFEMVNACGESYARDAALRLVSEMEDDDADGSD